MRILHTSDWHLGRTFGEHRLLDQQAEFADWLVEVVRAESVDLLVVAGDLFDRSVPPADAVELLWDTFSRTVALGARVAAIAGNHDSAERLGATDGLVDRAGVYLRGGYGRAAEVTELTFADGPLALVTTPYLDPRSAPGGFLADGVVPTHGSVLAAALGRARTAVPAGLRSVVLSHAFVTGAAPSTSERELSVGDSAMVSAQAYEGFSYVALGHLHRSQRVAGSDHIRYPGSPLRFSFGEAAPKEVLLVDLSVGGAVEVRGVEVEVGRGVRTVSGALEDLEAGPADTSSWVRVELTDEVRPTDAARRLRGVFPWLVEVEWVGGRHVGPGPSLADVRRRTASELTVDFWREATGAAPSPEELAVLEETLATEPAPGVVAA